MEDFLALTKGANPGACVKLPGSLYLVREYGRITLSTRPPQKKTIKPFERTLKVPGRTHVSEIRSVFKSSFLKSPPGAYDRGNTAYFDYDSIEGPVLIRKPMPGDKMVPLGMKGHRKLKEIFIDDKIPRARRPSIPILCAGKEILWAAGVRQSELHKVGPGTKRVLKVELVEGKRRTLS